MLSSLANRKSVQNLKRIYLELLEKSQIHIDALHCPYFLIIPILGALSSDWTSFGLFIQNLCYQSWVTF